MDKYLRQLQAFLVVANNERSYLISGTGDLIQPDDGILAIGSGGSYALAAARALVDNTQLEAAGDLRLADARGPDEDDVVRRDLIADGVRRALAAPAIPERDGDGLLRLALPDDVPVELGDDLAGREVGQAGNDLLRASAGHRE
jgi:hypothetical protein